MLRPNLGKRHYHTTLHRTTPDYTPPQDTSETQKERKKNARKRKLCTASICSAPQTSEANPTNPRPTSPTLRHATPCTQPSLHRCPVPPLEHATRTRERRANGTSRTFPSFSNPVFLASPPAISLSISSIQPTNQPARLLAYLPNSTKQAYMVSLHPIKPSSTSPTCPTHTPIHRPTHKHTCVAAPIQVVTPNAPNGPTVSQLLLRAVAVWPSR